ncbi:MAG: tRNA uridine-5-carboxymethylaminomethyl(34) synthesis GTPase MnmE [Phycisphaerae bacterium]|nr:tRNA uridine-5-carboxymethylaminomethyl(34) synthesis GTPase MnmE [Phycisphaerae bacterium]
MITLASPNDTIVAISSAGGHGGRGIVRLSGPAAFDAIATVFTTDNLQGAVDNARSFEKLTGRCSLKGSITSPATVYTFRSGQSYTTEEMVELHLPGSPTLLQMVLGKLLGLDDIRMAQPGEFTARAFLNGRIDLTEAEAVAEVIHARSDTQLRAAERLLDGQLHQFCASISGQLSDILAEIEADIDFSDGDDVDLVIATQESIHQQLTSVLTRLDELLKNSRNWDEIHHLPVVVLAGPANAGKSSLANRLLGMDRSIVSQIAGTTRDLLSAPLKLTDGECLLIDTAGLGDVVDPLAGETQSITQKAISGCDLLIWIVDASKLNGQPIVLPEQLKRPANVLTVANKADLVEVDAVLNLSNLIISAVSGYHIDRLLDTINWILHREAAANMTADAIALTSRQQQALTEGRSSIASGIETVSMGYPQQAEILALEIRDALDSLGNISGQVVNEEILSKIFQNFCIGK